MAAEEMKKTVVWPDRSGLPTDALRPNKRQVTMRPFTFLRDWDSKSSASPQETQAAEVHVRQNLADASTVEREDPSRQSPTPMEVSSPEGQGSMPEEASPEGQGSMPEEASPEDQGSLPEEASPLVQKPTPVADISPIEGSTSVAEASPAGQISTPGQQGDMADESQNSFSVQQSGGRISVDSRNQLSAESSDENKQGETTDVTPSVQQNRSRHSSASTNKSSADHTRTQRFKTSVTTQKGQSRPSTSKTKTPGTRKTPAVAPSTHAPVSRPSHILKSRPVARVKRRRDPESPRQGNETKPTEIGHVRMWIGGGRHRTMADLTDLDVILNMVEDETLDYRETVDSSACRRGINEFFIQFKKTMTDFIDLSQEHRLLRSAVARNATRTRQLRKSLLSLGMEDQRLQDEIAAKKQKLDEKKEHKKAMEEISEFQTDFEDLFQEYVKTAATAKPRSSDYNCPSNLTGLVRDVGNTLQTVTSLRSTNDALQQWLDAK